MSFEGKKNPPGEQEQRQEEVSERLEWWTWRGRRRGLRAAENSVAHCTWEADQKPFEDGLVCTDRKDLSKYRMISSWLVERNCSGHKRGKDGQREKRVKRSQGIDSNEVLLDCLSDDIDKADEEKGDGAGHGADEEALGDQNIQPGWKDWKWKQSGKMFKFKWVLPFFPKYASVSGTCYPWVPHMIIPCSICLLFDNLAHPNMTLLIQEIYICFILLIVDFGPTCCTFTSGGSESSSFGLENRTNSTKVLLEHKLGHTCYLGKTPLNLDFSLDLPSPVCYFSPSEQGVHQADLAEGDEFKKRNKSDGEVLEYIYIKHI